MRNNLFAAGTTTTFAERTFKKTKGLKSINPENLQCYPCAVNSVFNFSQTLLFLSCKEAYRVSLLKEIKEKLTTFEGFLAAYIYLVKNGFPEQDDKAPIPYKSFDDILDSAIRRFSKCTDIKKLAELTRIIHLLLLNPKIDLSRRFKLDSSEGSLEVAKTPLEHIFSIWCEAAKGKKEKLSDLLVHFITISPDLSPITPATKLNFTYGVLSLFMGYFINEYMLTGNSWFVRQINPILGFMLKASSGLVGYFATLYIIDCFKSCLLDDNRLVIDQDYLSGSFAERIPIHLKEKELIRLFSNNVPISLKGRDLNLHLSDMLSYDEKPQSYKDLYIKRRLLLQKYGAIKKLVLSSKLTFKFLQFNPLLADLSKLYERLDIAPSESKIFKKEGLPEVFRELASRTFNDGNFAALETELATDKRKQEFLLKVYDMADKGFISLDMQTMHVMTELANRIIYYSLETDTKASVEAHKAPSNNLTFQAFQYAVDTCRLAEVSECSPDEFKKIASINNDSVDVDMKIRHGELEILNVDDSAKSREKLNIFDKLWRQKLREFDKLYETESEFGLPLQASTPARQNMRDWINNNILPFYTNAIALHSSLQSLLGRNLPENSVFSNNEEQGYPITTGFGTLVFGILAYNMVSSTLIITLAAITARFYPEIKDKMDVTKKYCSDSYVWVSDAYKEKSDLMRTVLCR